MTIPEQLDKIGSAIVEKLKADIKTKRITKFGVVNASGKLADSVRYEVYDLGVRIYALDYIYYLQFGRAPNKNKSTEALHKWVGWAGSTFIKDWVEEKGINLNPYAVAYSIARKGNTVYQQGGSDLVTGVIQSEFFTNLVKELTDNFVAELVSPFEVK